jgi:hypothetical protein
MAALAQAQAPTKVKSRLLGRLRLHNKESRLVNQRAAALNRRQRP